MLNKKSACIIAICILGLIAGCAEKDDYPDPGILTIDLEHEIDSNILGGSLNEFIDTIRYIPLETDSMCLLDNIQKVKFYNGNIFVMDRSGIYKFNQEGKFHCKIINKGRGPTESIIIADFFIRDNTIYVRGWNQLYIFDVQTNILLSTIKIDQEYNINYINMTKEHFVSFNYTNNMIEYYNIEGIAVDSVYYSRSNTEILDRAILHPYYDLFFGCENSLHFSTYCNDTIFEVDDSFNLIPKYIVDLGKYKIPEKLRPDVAPWETFYQNASPYIRKMIIETNDYLFIQLGHWRKSERKSVFPEYPDKKAGISGLAIYDKKDKKVSLVSKDREHFPCFYPNFTDSDNHLLSFVNPIDAISIYHQFSDKYEVNNSFINAIKKLKIDDNPIIIIAKLKE